MVAVTSMHGYMTAFGFVPYFLLAAAGVELPYIGISTLETSYSGSPTASLVCVIAAIYLATGAYLEIQGKMPIDIFCYGHYLLSLVVLWWQLQPTTTTLGIVFWAAPQMFALWGTVAMFRGDLLPKAMV